VVGSVFHSLSSPLITTMPAGRKQGPGELLFVPSGWHHTVHNLQDTLSINHSTLVLWQRSRLGLGKDVARCVLPGRFIADAVTEIGLQALQL
jgi:hypothetical protein